MFRFINQCVFLVVVFLFQFGASLGREQRQSSSTVDAEPNVPFSELSALWDLYSSTNGNSWVWNKGQILGVPWNFSHDCNPCTDNWQGVTCGEAAPGGVRHVVRLDLRDSNLRGPLVPSLGNLTKLLILELRSNALHGTIPAELFLGARSLEIVALLVNELSGSIPSEIGYLQNLRVLDLEVNGLLSGTIPASLGNNTRLQLLLLSGNMLTGTLPLTLSALTDLRVFKVVANQLSGTFPEAFSAWTQLEVLLLAENYFQGSLDFCCSYARLTWLGTVANFMTGTLPACLGDLPHLRALSLGDSSLSGTIPPSFGEAPWLRSLTLFNNDLTGTIPNVWVAGENTTELRLDHNHLWGTIPEAVYSLTRLTTLKLSDNLLSGTLSQSLGGLQFMGYLYFSTNALHGTLPRGMAALHNLIELYLQDNHLSGNLYDVFNAAIQTQLLIVQLSNNRLTGTLPPEAFLAPLLNTFVAVSNCFSGTLPPQICQNPRMVSLILDGLQTACRTRLTPAISDAYVVANDFYGQIPTCLFEMRSLTSLHLSGNGLTGCLPGDTELSPSLVDFAASNNALTGTLPAAFQEHVWENLDLSVNRLTGELQASFGTQRLLTAVTIKNVSHALNLSFEAQFHLENNRISGRVPQALVPMANATVLGSNLFSCKVDKSDLPQHDPGRWNYQCGSTSFNYPYYLWLACALLVVAAAGLCAYNAAWVEQRPWLQRAVECHRKWMPEGDRLGRNLKYVLDVGDLLCRVGLGATVAIVLVLVPWYATASHYFGTYTHQYGWVVSAAFLSGAAPAMVQLALFVLLLGGVVYGLVYSLTRYGHKERSRPPSVRGESASVDSRFALAEGGDKALLSRRLCIYGAFLAANAVLVGGANLAFVLTALYGTAEQLVAAQVLLSLFKLGWNSVAVPHLISWLSEYVSQSVLTTGLVTIQAVTSLFNNIAIPCLIVAVLSTSCFNHVFHQPEAVVSTFLYLACESYGLNNICVSPQLQQMPTSFSSPFVYSYQCSSSFVTYYAPAFVYLALAASFGVPLLKVAVQQLHKRATPGTRWHLALDAVLPRLLKPIIIVLEDGTVAMRDSTSSPEFQGKARPYFDANIYIISLITYLGILLTFGVVFPPLAVAMCVTMLSVAWQGKLAVGRFLHNARELNALKFVDVIEQECKGAATLLMIQHTVFTISLFACLFYALFLYDTLGDDVGQRRAYWVLVVVPLFPLCVAAAVQARAWWRGGSLANQLRVATQAAERDEEQRSAVVAAAEAETAAVGVMAGAVEMGRLGGFVPSPAETGQYPCARVITDSTVSATRKTEGADGADDSGDSATFNVLQF